MLHTMFRIIWQSGFSGEEFQKSTNQKQDFTVAAMFVSESERNDQSIQRTAHRCFLPSFGSFDQAVSEEKIFKNQPIRSKNCLWRPWLLTDRNETSNMHRGPSINASYQVSIHLAKPFQRRRFLEIGQSEKKLLVATMFLNRSGPNEQSLQRTFNKCFLPSFGSIGKAVSLEKIFRNGSIRNKN